MLIKQKKIIVVPVLIILLCIVATVPSSIHAQENIDMDEQPNVVISEEEPLDQPEFTNSDMLSDIGVSTICPDDMDNRLQPFSSSRPSRVWNVSTKGKYSFQGAINSTKVVLYTNHKFKGKSSYTIYVKNTGKTSINVKAKRLTKTYATTDIKAGKVAVIGFSNIKKTTEFYLTFKGSSFSGYIK